MKLSEEYAKSTDIERLEERIDNLRFAVICLIILVSLLSIDAIFQLAPQDLLLPSFAVVGMIILLFILSTSCQKTIAPSPKPESQSTEDSSV
jgi:hypothetical protein